MSPGFSNEFKELVRSRTDLVSLIGESVALSAQRGGLEFAGLCPFHEDHNPSMRVYPDRQSFRCWVCQEGGDCYTWVMKIEGVEFPEALESLAKRAGLEMPRRSQRRGSQSSSERGRLYDVLAWAEREFHQFLLTSPQAAAARAYLENDRGLSREMITRFRLGHHPGGWQWLLNLARGMFTAEELFAAKLVRPNRDGSGYYDDFRGRVLFPIHDKSGRPVAFGGRILPGAENGDAPKYLNSSESSVFKKSELLYGLHAARQGIRRTQTVVVTEGYTDCITAHQYGIENVVGTLGTALTELHVGHLKRIARKVVLVYDGDAAGQDAAERALIKFLTQNVDLRILILPDNMDPAEYLEREGTDAFRRLIDAAPEAWDHKFRLEVERDGVESIESRHRVLEAMLELLGQVPQLAGTAREDIIVAKLSQRLSLAEQTVRKRLIELRKTRPSSAPAAGGKAQRVDVGAPDQSTQWLRHPSKDELVELELLEIIFSAPETIDAIRRHVACEELTNRPLKDLLGVCYELAERGTQPSFENVTLALEDSHLKRLAVLIDDQSREKEVGRKLRDGRTAPQTDIPPFLSQTLENLKWRREQQSHERTKGQLARKPQTPSGLDQSDKALLQQWMEFHQKRATKKTLT